MADIDKDPAVMSAQGHTEPIESYQGGQALQAGLVVTVGPDSETWTVVRVDPLDGVFHLRRA
ncbi:hypothetical protein [Actinomadura sp. 21ATH]|uniref:hypothetical protein n=1 Tax=Actinomadura sp. 21ATH TaxID=1735444 RepID=UPI0035BFDB51